MSLKALALRLYSARAMRRRFLPDSMFGEQSWDILLALYGLADGVTGLDLLSESTRRPVDWTMRWISYLEDQGLVVRKQWMRGPVVQLTDEGREALESYLVHLSAFPMQP